PFEDFAKGSRVPGGYEEAGHTILDRVGQTPDRGCHHGAATGHRLPRDDAVPLAAGRDADDGRALVVRPELSRRDEADGFGHLGAERPVAYDYARQALGRLEELEDPFLVAEPTD